VDQLEEEQFDHSFVIAVVSKEEAIDLENHVRKVSEVEEVTVLELTAEHLQNQNKPEDSITEPAKKVPVEKGHSEDQANKPAGNVSKQSA
ncbi:hypothetical protein R0K17_24675, partial [Planococcus sp. SIMBA_143]